MAEPDSGDEGAEASLPAGDFSSWLAQMQAAVGGDAGSDVPCAGCTACCTSFQFVHIDPDETETLARIPVALLSPAPRMPAGHMVLGYDDHGHCPMLIDNRCSIYEHRPRTCRTYDCRVFAATGVEAADGQELIARRSRRWRFEFPTPSDRTAYEAVRAAVSFVEQQREVWADPASITPTRLAAMAVTVSAAFVEREASTGALRPVEPDPEEVRLQLTMAPPRCVEGGRSAGPLPAWSGTGAD